MLVVSRKRGEAVCIGDDIIVRVLESSGGSVRLGIDAPKQVPILREELRIARVDSLVQNGAKEMACAFGHL
jgi:carbon storage regulator